MFLITTAIKKISTLQKRIRAIPGGTSAAKTVGIEAVLIDLAQKDTTPTITSIVSESLPHLRKGAIRDFIRLMEEQRYFNRDRWNKTDYTYTFETGSKIEFFSVDQASKVRGPRRNRLFINEANNIPFETFEQLEIRTSEFVFLDWNPTSEFWYYTDVKPKRDDVEELTLTYLDNEGLEPTIIKSIEQRKQNKNWWLVYGEGKLGELIEKIYTGWQIIDEIPHEARLERTGLDYGYTNDPTAIVDVYYHNGGYVFDEIVYQRGLSNAQIASILKNKERQAPVAPDSAEPKSNDELKSFGLTVLEVPKGKGSVNQGIQFVQDKRCSITKRSTNLIKEYRNYCWLTDKDGKIINEPDHTWSHSMDAIRYAMQTLRPQDPVVQIKQQQMFIRNMAARQINSNK